MPTTPQLTFSNKRTEPVYGDGEQIAVPLAPGTYAQGQVLGQISGANTDDVQTITVSGAPTHATLTLTNLPGGASYTAAQDITPAALTTALNALLGANSVTVTGTYTAGSGGTYILTWGGSYANQPIGLVGVSAAFVGGTSPAVANVHTTPGVGPNGSYGIYAAAHSDGTQNAVGLLEYPCVVTATGGIYLGNAAASEFGQTDLTAPMWYEGDFDLADITGLDSTAVSALGAKFITGSLASGAGVVHIP